MSLECLSPVWRSGGVTPDWQKELAENYFQQKQEPVVH